MRRLSASSLKMYRQCPQRWKLKYIDGLPEAPKPFFNLGTAVHAALEAFYRGCVVEPPPLEEVLETFGGAFDPDAYPTEEEAERRRADGLAMVEAFYEKHAGGFRPALAVEKRLSFEVEGVPFTGFVDRIDKLGEARIGIVDYKTGGSFDLDRVRTEPQLTLYQIGTEQKLGMKVSRLALYHVPSQTPFEVERHGEEQVDRVRAMVREAARGIEAGAFEPSPGHHCRWCDFRPFCPAFADEYPDRWLQEPAPPAPTHAEAAALADRYGALTAGQKELKEELAEVKERLEAFFEATGERAVSGAGYRVKASRKEDWRIEDDAALRELLEPLGLWERVLVTSVDWRRKAGLPDDAELPEDVREACRALASRKVTWRLTAGEAEAAEPDDSEA